MKKGVICFVFMLVSFISGKGFSQSNLVPGDIVFTGINMDNPDEFSIVFMVNIEMGTTINFTDNGWKSSGVFRTGEGVFSWVSPMAYSAGDEVVIVSDNIALSSSGDQILAYQGTFDNPVFIAAVNDEGSHEWQDDATSAGTSALPSGLINGLTCVALDETDNIKYNRVVETGGRQEILSAVNNYSHWFGSNTERQVLDTTGFIVLSDPGHIPFLVINEIFYDDTGSVNSNYEFIEIYNNDTALIDLSGYYFSGGVDFMFPDSVFLGVNEYCIVCRDTTFFDGIQVAKYQWLSDSLNNEGELIELRMPVGYRVDAVHYLPDWANGVSKGLGSSLELKSFNSNNELAYNWKASYEYHGTPGMTNSIAPDSAVWNGSFTLAPNNWNALFNWQGNKYPGAITHVVVDGTINFPVISDSSQCANLVLIPQANITIDSGGVLQVHGDLLLKSDSLSTATLLCNNQYSSLFVNGLSQIEQYITGGLQRDPSNATYHYISSPVDEVVAGSVFPGTSFVRAYDEPEQTWVNLVSSDSLAVMKGYSVWLEGGDEIVTYSGELNSGNFSLDSLSYTPGKNEYNSEYAGFNLIGNPYPSAYNWDDSGTIKSNLDNAIYFWNSTLGGYSSYVNGIGNNPATTNSTIPVGQGFFVRVNQPGNVGGITFTDSGRLHPDCTFYKSENADEPIRLTVSGEGGMDQTTLVFNNYSTNEYDPEYDAWKLFGSTGVPQIFSILEDDVKTSINSRPFSGVVVVDVGFVADTPGTYRITAEGIAGIEPTVSAILTDIFLNETVNLREVNEYVFDHDTGNDHHRFSLTFSESSNIETFTEPDVYVTSFAGFIEYDINCNGITCSVAVYNSLGQLVSRNNGKNLISGRIRVTEPGLYLIDVVGRNIRVVKKVYVF